MSTRTLYCRCNSVQNFDYSEAAAKLGCKVRYLQDNIRTLPHQKHGRRVAFCECELSLIRAMNTVVPDNVIALITPQPAPAPVSAENTPAANVRDLRPSGARKHARR